MEIEENERINRKLKEQIEVLEKEIVELERLRNIYQQENPRLVKERDFLLSWADVNQKCNQ